MSYKKFNFEKLAQQFGIVQKKQHLFPHLKHEIEGSPVLLRMIEIGMASPITTEKAASEAFVYPIMQEIKLRNVDKIELFSGENLDGDKSKELNGECDFIFAKAPYAVELKAPIITIVEAKQANLDKATAQAAAQMQGARLFNQKKGTDIDTIYGATTSGTEWLFLKLEGNVIYIDVERYSIQKLPQLLGILDYIVNLY